MNLNFDIKEKQLLDFYCDKIKQRTFDEHDIYAFYILVRGHLENTEKYDRNNSTNSRKYKWISELGDLIDSPVRTYSSGQYMRLAFSVAINVDAEILLIDEILAVGDQHFQEKCFNKLEELASSEMTIVIVSHSLESLKKLCKRAIWIHEGKIAMDGDCSKVVEEYLKVCG